jgi:hypothetical protein
MAPATVTSFCKLLERLMGIRGFALAAGLVALVPLVGCGDTSMSEVEGTVTFGGQPVQTGAISFVPVAGDTPTAGGMIEGGRYSVKVPPGVMKVSISAPKIVGKKKIYDTPNSPEMPITEEGLPKKYNEETELRYTVPRGPNSKNWDLPSK